MIMTAGELRIAAAKLERMDEATLETIRDIAGVTLDEWREMTDGQRVARWHEADEVMRDVLRMDRQARAYRRLTS